RRDAAGVEPRDGRGRTVRATDPHPRRVYRGPRHAGRGARVDRHRRPRRGVPAPRPADGGGEGLMSLRITLNTTARILRQLRHDPRTIGLLIVVPALLLTLMRYVFNSEPAIFNRVGVIMLGVFPFIAMFLITSVAMLRERTTGTLERL